MVHYRRNRPTFVQRESVIQRIEMETIDHMRLAAALVPSVLAAGAIEMRHYRAGVTVEAKADQSPVTVADREAEAVLVAAIAAAAPTIPIIAEEAVSAGRVPAIGAEFFLVDPLDGTREFIEQRGEFTVNIALVREGVPVFGIVYAPATEELYVTLAPDRAAMARVAPRDEPVMLAGLDLAPIHTRRPDPSALVALASRSHSNADTETFLARYHIAKRTNAGSSLKFCAIARGAADIYPRLGPTMEWDTAAGHAVLLTAGGAVTTLDGAPLRYGDTSRGLRNPHFVAWGTPGPIAPAV
jgi:3'(2'), 5'-bisphosphate nucleotidase